MRFWRDNSRAALLLVILLPVLLGVLATLQYRWLTEISSAERTRLKSRLETDVQRFAQDFNAEISKAYLIFQLDARSFEKENSDAFAERYDSWRANATFPNIVGEIYFVSERNSRLFNPSSRIFETVEPPAELGSLRTRLLAQKSEAATNFAYDKSLIDERILSLTIPIFRSNNDVSSKTENVSSRSEITTKYVPEGFIIVKFDRASMTSEMLPELARKSFGGDFQAYDFAVTDSGGETVFQSASSVVGQIEPDGAANFFDLSPGTPNVVVLNGGYQNSVSAGEKQVKIVRERLDTQNLPESAGAKNEEKESQTNSDEPRKVKVVRNYKNIKAAGDKSARNGLWLLSVRHKEGSLENFVGRTKWRNLSLSFGILMLLGASVVLLLVSAQRSRRAAQRQFDFVSSVSHEFRTPVAVIRSAGVNLARGIIQEPAQIKKYGDVIDREGGRIGEMVEQILEFAGAKSNRHNYNFQPVAVAPLVEQVLTDSRPLLEQNGFLVEKTFEPDLPPVNADAKSLRQALENLVGNAVKYSGENWQIKISAFAEGTDVVLSIEDRGIGIPAQELKNIFEPFYRGREAIAEQIRGSGLGLNLVKRIVTAHNGKISVESEPGKGSKFTIKLPAKLKSDNDNGNYR